MPVLKSTWTVPSFKIGNYLNAFRFVRFRLRTMRIRDDRADFVRRAITLHRGLRVRRQHEKDKQFSDVFHKRSIELCWAQLVCINGKNTNHFVRPFGLCVIFRAGQVCWPEQWDKMGPFFRPKNLYSSAFVGRKGLWTIYANLIRRILPCPLFKWPIAADINHSNGTTITHFYAVHCWRARTTIGFICWARFVLCGKWKTKFVYDDTDKWLETITGDYAFQLEAALTQIHDRIHLFSCWCARCFECVWPVQLFPLFN